MSISVIAGTRFSDRKVIETGSTTFTQKLDKKGLLNGNITRKTLYLPKRGIISFATDASYSVTLTRSVR